MLGAEFTRILRAAREGDEAAFVRLWRDANPVMVRYLRVCGMDDPYDAAFEGWVTVVRGLHGFKGDETAWRVWLMACARMRAEESSLRRSWGSVTVLPGPWPRPGEEPLEMEDLEPTGDPGHRGVGDALAAIRALPLGQGEVVMLRLCAGLPESAVADVVGIDVTGVRRTEARALERLAIDRELLTWSLAAPAMPAELADERAVTGAFRSLPHPGRRGGARVVAIGPRQDLRSRQGRGTRPTAGWSRSALVGVAAVSASVVSLGGLGAAAYTGSLPAPVQQVMHDAIGAPAPHQGRGAPGDGGTPGPGGMRPGRGMPSTAPGNPAHPTGSPTPARGGNGTPASKGAPASGGPSGTPHSQPGKTQPTKTQPTHTPPTHTGPGSGSSARTTPTHPANPRRTESGSPTSQHSGKGQTASGAPAANDGAGTGARTAGASAPAAPTADLAPAGSAGGRSSGRASGAASGAASGKASPAR